MGKNAKNKKVHNYALTLQKYPLIITGTEPAAERQ